MDNPLVAVFMVTYNHEKFIAQAIESVLMQKTNFPIKLFIGEDCSTDQTAAICLKYQVENPGLIEAKINKQNKGAINNAKQIYYACFASDAKYIAMLEGDDYWTDPYKLQKQVDFMESNSEYSMTCHLVDIVNEDTGEITRFGRDFIINNKNREITINNFLDPFLILTVSVVFRNEAFNYENNCHDYFKDISLFGEVLSKGKGLLLNECMAVYRLHSGGIWSKRSDLIKVKSNAYTLIEMNKYTNYKINHIRTNASLQILDYLNLLIADRDKNILEKSKIFIILFLHYRTDIGNKMLLKLLLRVLKSILCF